MRGLVLALLLIGCTGAPPFVAPSPAPTHEPNTVNVSVLLDLSGSRAPSGQPQRDAMQLWLDRPPPTVSIKVRVKFVDVAGSSAKLLLELRRAAVEDRADAVVVGVSVAGDDPFAQAAEVAQLPILLTLPTAEPIAATRGRYLFALAPAPEAIARAIAGDIVDRGIVAPMLLATDGSPSGVVERGAFVSDLVRRGITPPAALTVGSSDGAQRIRLAAAVAKSAVFTGPAASYGDLIRSIAPAPGVAVARIYLSYLTETADLVNLRDAGAFVTWPGARGTVGGSSTLAASAYDALTLIEAAAARAPAEIDPARLRQRLEANTVAGVATRYTFTPSRHVGFAPDDLALLAWDPQRGAALVPSRAPADR